jgi:hypothetical protein
MHASEKVRIHIHWHKDKLWTWSTTPKSFHTKSKCITVNNERENMTLINLYTLHKMISSLFQIYLQHIGSRKFTSFCCCFFFFKFQKQFFETVLSFLSLSIHTLWPPFCCTPARIKCKINTISLLLFWTYIYLQQQTPTRITSYPIKWDRLHESNYVVYLDPTH